jgi:hypothetical protein
MKTFRHDFRVFEATPTSGAQIEVTLLSSPEPDADRKSADRVSTGTCMGRIRLFVDMAFIDIFALGKKFTVTLQEREK